MLLVCNNADQEKRYCSHMMWSMERTFIFPDHYRIWRSVCHKFWTYVSVCYNIYSDTYRIWSYSEPR